MATRLALASLQIVAAEDTPDMADALATAGRWQQGEGGLRTFVDGGGVVPDEAARQDMLTEIEESLAWVAAHESEISAGNFGEVTADLDAEAKRLGLPLATLLTQKLEDLKTVVTSASATPEADTPETSEAPADAPDIPGVVVTSRTEDPLTEAISEFNKARQKVQELITTAGDSHPDSKKKLEDIMFAMNELETRAAGDLGTALNAKMSPETAKEAVRLMKEVHSMDTPTQVQASTAVTADVVGDTIRSVVNFTRVNLPKFKSMLTKPEGAAKFRQELERVPGGQQAGQILPLVQQVAAGTLNEEGFVAGLERIFRRNNRQATAAFLEENAMMEPGTKVKCASDGTIHVMGLSPNPRNFAKLAKFAAKEGIPMKMVKAFEDEEASCPQCSGPGIPLGSLGSRAHYRCRDCGMGFSHDKAEDESNTFSFDRKTSSEDEPVVPDGTVAAGAGELVFEESRTAAGPSPEDHVIKVGTQYLVVGDDTTNPATGGVALSLAATQKAATRMSKELAKLWLTDDRLSGLLTSEVPDGVEAQVVRIVPKTAAAAVPQVPTAAGNHAGPANPVNPTGAPAPGTPAPAPGVQPPAAPANQGPAVNRINPGTKPPAPVQAAGDPDDVSDVFQPLMESAKGRWHVKFYTMKDGHPDLIDSLSGGSWQKVKMDAESRLQDLGATDFTVYKDGPGRWIMGAKGTAPYAWIMDNSHHTASRITASEGTLNGLLSEAEGTISQLQELADGALAKARLLNDESLVAAAERMNTAIFEAGMAARHAKGLAAGASTPEAPARPEALAEAGKQAAKSTKCVKCDKTGNPDNMTPNPDGAGYMCKPSCGPWPKKKEAGEGTCDCGGTCECKDGEGQCDGCRKKATKTADSAEVSALARETVMGWTAAHPGQVPDWNAPEFAQAFNDNKSEVPDMNTFLRACQTAYAELNKAGKKSSSLHMASLLVTAMGLQGPTAEEGDSVENAVKFLHSNAKDIEDQTVAEARQTLADAGYGRMTAETALGDVFGDEALLANGALLKDLLK